MKSSASSRVKQNCTTGMLLPNELRAWPSRVLRVRSIAELEAERLGAIGIALHAALVPKAVAVAVDERSGHDVAGPWLLGGAARICRTAPEWPPAAMPL